MTRGVVLDAGALSALGGRPARRFLEVRAALRAAERMQASVVVPAVVLAELYRGQKHSQVVDSSLAREPGIVLRATDRQFARIVGAVLAAAGLGSEHLADAHVVAACIELGTAVALTTDPVDLTRLAAPYPGVRVSGLP